MLVTVDDPLPVPEMSVMTPQQVALLRLVERVQAIAQSWPQVRYSGEQTSAVVSLVDETRQIQQVQVAVEIR